MWRFKYLLFCAGMVGLCVERIALHGPSAQAILWLSVYSFGAGWIAGSWRTNAARVSDVEAVAPDGRAEERSVSK